MSNIIFSVPSITNGDAIMPPMMIMDLIVVIAGIIFLAVFGKYVGCVLRFVAMLAIVAVIVAFMTDLFTIIMPTNVNFFQSFM